MTQSEGPVIQWQDYLGIINRRKWWFIIPSIVIVAATMITMLFLTPIYMASAYVLIDNPQIISPLINEMAIATDVDQRLQVVQLELLGDTSVSRIIERLGLDAEVSTPRERQNLIEDFKQHFVISITKKGKLVNIRFYDPDPKLAQQVVNTVTDVYVERSRESQTGETQTAIKFIESEIEVYKTKLEEAEKALREFDELYSMEVPVAMALNNVVVDREISLQGLLVHNTEEHPRVKAVRREIEEIKQQRNAELKKVVLRAMTRGRNPELYADLAAQLEQAEEASQSADLSAEAREAHEAYEAWVERMDSAAQSVATGGGVSREDAQLVRAGEAVESVATPTSITLLPRQHQEKIRLTRDYEVLQNTYHRMQERVQRAMITRRFGESDEGVKFRVIEPARLPTTPVFPIPLFFFLGSLLAGIVVGGSLVFVIEWMDESFQTPDEVQVALALPVLGTISRIVTEEDVEERRRRRQELLSPAWYLSQFKRTVAAPIWKRIDQLMVHWGL